MSHFDHLPTGGTVSFFASGPTVQFPVIRGFHRYNLSVIRFVKLRNLLGLFVAFIVVSWEARRTASSNILFSKVLIPSCWLLPVMILLFSALLFDEFRAAWSTASSEASLACSWWPLWQLSDPIILVSRPSVGGGDPQERSSKCFYGSGSLSEQVSPRSHGALVPTRLVLQHLFWDPTDTTFVYISLDPYSVSTHGGDFSVICVGYRVRTGLNFLERRSRLTKARLAVVTRF